MGQLIIISFFSYVILNSIDSMAQDIKSQPEVLPRIKLPAPMENATFVGSGDSYAAALAACYLSSGRATCWHPADIISDPSLIADRNAYFVSISGRTNANIRAAVAARKARTIATTIAITANAKSPLAAACNNVFELGIKGAGRTSGTIGFSASMLACLHLATNGAIVCPANLREIYVEASKAASKVASKVGTESVIMLGNSFLFSAALYCALKFNELFGSRAQACPLEEFFHAPLFGLKRDDQVLVFGKTADAALAKSVRGLFVRCSMRSPIESLFYGVFFIQHLVLAIARRKKLTECYFVQNKKLLKTSSDVIY